MSATPSTFIETAKRLGYGVPTREPVPEPTPFERAQLAAIFMSKWVDGSESTAPERMAKRVANAFAFADMMWAKAHEVKP